MKEFIDKNHYYSVTEAASLLNISRTAVLKRIHQGHLKAERIGHIFAIPKSELNLPKHGELSESQKEILEAAVKKTVEEYGEALRMLGRD